jgi:DNA-binding GntR family transcriptional regulator
MKEKNMAATVAQMTKRELREMMETLIEQKLLELLGDPDEGLEIRKSVRDRLLRQRKAVAAGERGKPFEDVVRQLGLE